jgi:dGTPase
MSGMGPYPDIGRIEIPRSSGLLARFEVNARHRTQHLLKYLKNDVTYKTIVRSRGVQTLEFKGERIISDLFDAFWQRPIPLVGLTKLDPFHMGAGEILSQNEKESIDKLADTEKAVVARAICDFIAGMTNPYAEKYHRRLFEPGFGSSTDEL